MDSEKRFTIAAGAALLAQSFIGGPAKADAKYINDNKSRFFVSHDFIMPKAIQECNQWCWAASISFVLKFQNCFVSQQELAKTMFGYDDNGNYVCMGATTDELVDLLDGLIITYPDGGFDRQLEAVVIANGPDIMDHWLDQLVVTLRNDWPILLSYRHPYGGGHCVVLTEVTVVRESGIRWKLVEAYVYDPWPETNGRRKLTPDQLKRTDFLCTVFAHTNRFR